MASSTLENAFQFYLSTAPGAAGLPAPAHNYRFAAHATGGVGRGVRARLDKAGLKDWRLDFAWVEARVAVELEGGTWVNGRHSRPTGYAEDCWKYSCAQLMGWIVLRYTGDMLESFPETIFEHIRLALSLRASENPTHEQLPRVPLDNLAGLPARPQPRRAGAARRQRPRRRVLVLSRDKAQQFRLAAVRPLS